MSFDFSLDDEDIPSFDMNIHETSDIELPGMWEHADFEGGQDETRGADWVKPEPVIPDPPVDNMTTEEVDDIFADIAGQIESDEDVIAASAAIMAAEYEVTQAEMRVEEGRQEYDDLDKERKELEKKLGEVSQRQAVLRKAAMDVRSIKRQADSAMAAAQRKLEVAKENVRVRFERVKDHQTFKQLAADKAWNNGVEFGEELYKIMPHQWIGAEFLATAHGAILGDGMGTGKTLTAIAGLDLVQAKRVLIIAQAEITEGFEAEVRMWAPHRNVINIKGMTKDQRNTALTVCKMLPNIVVLINYEAWRKDLTLVERLISVGFDTLIIDEAHNIKGTDTVAYKGINAIVKTVNLCPVDQSVMPELIDTNGNVLKGVARICLTCGWQGKTWESDTPMDDRERYYHQRTIKNVWCTTGTPILNKPQDLYALLSVTDPLNFHIANSFMKDYCDMDYYTGKWKFRSGGAATLMEHQLSGRYLARSMEDAGIELPPQFPVIHDLTIDKENYPDQWEVIRQLTEHSQLVLNSGRSMAAIVQIALITRQRQANVWPGGISWTEVDVNTGLEQLVKVSEEITESIKMDKAIELISEAIDRGERVVLFSQFKTALAELNNRLNGMILDSGRVVRAVRYDGDTPHSKRVEIKSNWDKKMGEDAKWDVLLAQYRLGGTGLNLTQATRTIILDEEWNPGKRDQAYGRTRRIGQDETTFIDVLRIEHTVDTWLAKLIAEKENLIGGFNESALNMQEEFLKAFNSGEFGEFK